MLKDISFMHVKKKKAINLIGTDKNKELKYVIGK